MNSVVTSLIFNRQDDLIMNIHVKVCYTSNKRKYPFHQSTPLGDMIDKIKSYIYSDFGYRETQYELVDAGQPLPMETRCEDGYVFIIHDELDNQTSICNRFDNQKDIAFYIRIITRPIQPILHNNTVATNTPINVECVICQESGTSLNHYYHCDHQLCSDCYGGCVTAYIDRCAICRACEL